MNWTARNFTSSREADKELRAKMAEAGITATDKTGEGREGAPDILGDKEDEDLIFFLEIKMMSFFV